MNRRLFSATALGLGMLAIIVTACGDDDDDGSGFGAGGSETTEAPDTSETTAPAGGAFAEYCAAEAALEVLPPPQTPDEASEDEAAALLQQWAENEARPLVAAVVAAAPDDLATDAEYLAGALDGLIATGDTGVLSDAEYLTSVERMHDFDLANCGWNTLDIAASEYAFSGVPESLTSGVTNFDFTNNGSELHEIRVFRKLDGVTDSAEQLLALSEEEMAAKAEMVGSGEYAAPGDEGYFVTDLPAGEYFAVCFIPVGALSETEPPAPGAAPHHAEGMVAEFTVT